MPRPLQRTNKTIGLWRGAPAACPCRPKGRLGPHSQGAGAPILGATMKAAGILGVGAGGGFPGLPHRTS